MLSIVARTFVFYISLMFLMKISGKRQVGELQVSEFVTAVMISELAVFPITSKETPILASFVPLITVIFIEVFLSFICKKFSGIRRFFDGSPITLVRKGEIVEKNLIKTRVSIDEIFTEIRLHGYKDISEIQYVILEQNGKLSVFPQKNYSQPTIKELKIKSKEEGIGHCIIIEGYIDKNSLEDLGKSETWLINKINKMNISINDISYYIIDDSGNEKISIKKRSKKMGETK